MRKPNSTLSCCRPHSQSAPLLSTGLFCSLYTRHPHFSVHLYLTILFLLLFRLELQERIKSVEKQTYNIATGDAVPDQVWFNFCIVTCPLTRYSYDLPFIMLSILTSLSDSFFLLSC